jgi:hypothetical protein
MTNRELQALLARLTGYPESEVDLRIRPLREKNLIPHGPRGPGAPQLDAGHVVVMLLAMVSRRATDALEIFGYAKDATLVSARGHAFQLPTNISLAEILTLAVKGECSIDQIEIGSTGRFAYVSYDEGGKSVKALFISDLAEPKTRKVVTAQPAIYERLGLGAQRFVLVKEQFAEIVAAYSESAEPKKPRFKRAWGR